MRCSVEPSPMSVRGIRRARVVAATLAAVVGTSTIYSASASVATASTSAAVQTTWSRYEFVGKDNGLLVIDGTAEVGAGSFLVEANVGPDGDAYGDVLDFDAVGPVGTYGAVGHHDLCAGPLTCEVAHGRLHFGVIYQVEGDGRHRLDLRFYVAVRGRHVQVRDQLLMGWSAQHRHGGVVRRTAADTDVVGATVPGVTAGVNAGVSAPGPAGGSVAVAIPACDVVGAGLLRLSGGRHAATAVCPSDPVSAVAARRTKWTASGAVAGVSEYASRLVVLRA